MKGLKNARERREGEDDFYKAFARLGRERRWHVALRILRDQKMLKDLYDHFLTERSLAGPGDSVAWERFQG